MNNVKIKETDVRERLEQVLIALRTARHGELIGLTSVYERFDKPLGKSPFDVFAKTEIQQATQAFMAKYPEENLIDYRKDDIYVNYRLFHIYLKILVADTDESGDAWQEILALYREKHEFTEGVTKILQDFYSGFNYSRDDTEN